MTDASREARPSALILGLGYTGRTIARDLLAQGWRVTGTGRDRPNATSGPAGVETLVFHTETGEGFEAVRERAAKCDLLISSVPPLPSGADPVLTGLPGLRTHARAVIYLSATSVYGDRGGDWVFEAETPRPLSYRGRARVEAELRWLETGWPVHVLRLAGIYGPGRSAFSKLDRAVVKPDHVVNRIHVDDIAALVSAIAHGPRPGIYNVADGHPAPPDEVVRFAAGLAGAPAPREVAWTDPGLSAMARSFYAETKRVDASRARAAFGWEPRFGDYRSGLRAVWEAERAGGTGG